MEKKYKTPCKWCGKIIETNFPTKLYHNECRRRYMAYRVNGLKEEKAHIERLTMLLSPD